MSDRSDHRKPEEIEKDIHRSRERLDSTLHEIEERFSPQSLMNASYDYLRHGGANEFFANLSTTIKQNPVPFLLTGAGLGWMMMAQRQPDHAHNPQSAGTPHEPVSPASTTVSSAPPSYAATTGGLTSGAYSNRHAEVGGHENHHGRLSEMKHGAKDVKDSIKNQTRHLSQQAKETAHHWGERAQHLGGNMRHTTSHLQHNTQHSMHNASHWASDAGKRSSDFVQEHPLVAGALGFALGAALGGMFPSTRTEDKYLGEYRDQVMHKAADAGQEQIDKMQHTVHEKTEEMKERSDQEQKHSSATRDQRPSTQTSKANLNDPTSGSNSAAGFQGTPSDSPTPDSPLTGNKHPGLAGSNTPSGNTQGSGTNKMPKE